jgi:site-specific recombinase XerD
MLERALAEYLKSLAERRRYSVQTIDAYRRDLVPWVAFLEQHYVSMPDSRKNDPLLLRIYLRGRSEKGISNRSLARFISALSGFQKFLARRGGFEQCIFRLPKMKYSSRVPSFLPQQDAASLFDGSATRRDARSFFFRRDFLMIALLYATGIRREELAGVKLADVDHRQGLITVKGKGNKVRVVPVGEETMNDLNDYLVERDAFLRHKDA